MALRTVEWTERYVPVNKLSNLDVEFISLVPKGANMIPFQIVKSEGEDMNIIVQALSNATKAVQSLRDDMKSLKSKSAVAPLPSPELLTLRKDISMLENRVNSLFPEVKQEAKTVEPEPHREPVFTTKSEQEYLNLSKTAGKFSGLFTSGTVSADVDPERIQKLDAPVGKFSGAW